MNVTSEAMYFGVCLAMLMFWYRPAPGLITNFNRLGSRGLAVSRPPVMPLVTVASGG